MCGICGIVYLDGRPMAQDRITAMTNALIHRGPDDEGIYLNNWKEGSISVGLGFRRLSIIDLSGGHQPMKFKGKVVVFNGEIYNFQNLKKECESLGHQFLTQSDTEVLLHLYDEHGVACLEKLNGMFAFAVWNEGENEVVLARDRLGIKPLYYYYDPNQSKFVFASEIKALLRSEEVPFEFDPIGLMDFFTYRFVPSPYTILKNVRKLLPGHFISLKNRQLKDFAYWSLADSPKITSIGRSNGSSRFGTTQGGSAALEKELFELLEECVRSQMVSDVPLGSFLSGGVDSSLITALMARNSKQKVQTFSIGFEKETGVDESPYARRVARFIGTEHHELILKKNDLVYINKIFSFMNEPVADPTILPTALLSQFARKSVKVVLTGEGGDELFAGYNRYKAVIYSQWVKSLPRVFQPVARSIFRKVGRGATFNAIPNVNAGNWFLLNRDFVPELLQPLFQVGEEPVQWKSYLSSFESSSDSLSVKSGSRNKGKWAEDSLNAILALEIGTALADRLLMKVDMATMSESLEARPPYLDHRLVEFALQLPSSCKVKYFKGKYILRKTAERLLPKEICWRRKHGFILPITKWSPGYSKEWLQALREETAADSLLVFNKKEIQKQFEKIYNEGAGESFALLWPVLALSGWVKSVR